MNGNTQTVRFDDSGSTPGVNVARADLGSLRSPEKFENGWRRVDALFTRTGVFVYWNADGTSRAEYRPPEEVFDAASLASLASVPFTNNHPSDLLTADNAADHVRGWTHQDIAREGDYVRGSIKVIDKATADAMDRGKLQLSCGYRCDLDFTPGEINGVKYDAIQRRIRYNHISLVDTGRAGPNVRARNDGYSADLAAAIKDTENKPMESITLDGVTFEVTKQVAQAIAKYDAACKAAIDAAKAAADKALARADSADVALAAEKAARKDAEDPARVRARVTLQVTAAKYLPADTKFDGMSDREIKAAVVAKLSKPIAADKLDSDSYVSGRFDAEIERADASSATLGAANVTASGVKTDGKPPEVKTDSKSAYERMKADLATRHNKPISGATIKA